MKKILFITFCSLLTVLNCFAQQDPQYSQYMFNQMVINPAYAGGKDALSASLFLRSQWTGIEGAPKTESLTIHGPLKRKKVGLGLAIIGDEIGPKKSIGIMGSYAYRLKIKNGKLAFGLRAGVYNFAYYWNDITYKDQADIYNSQGKNSKIVPTADAGLYYNTTSMYAGISATHLYNGRLTSVSNQNGDDAQFSPHFFFTLGKAWSVSEKLTFNPSCIVKMAKHSPTSADVNFSFLLDNRVWFGVSIRSTYGLVCYTQLNITEKLKLGYSYDFGFNKIGRAGGGSHELMISYDFNIYKSKMLSPRYL